MAFPVSRLPFGFPKLSLGSPSIFSSFPFRLFLFAFFIFSGHSYVLKEPSCPSLEDDCADSTDRMALLVPPGMSRGKPGQIEIDLVIRRGNNVGLIEAKTGSGKRGIDQLDTAGNSHYLGKFSTKFLITGRPLSREHKALAVAQQVYVIELPGYRRGRSLPKRERQILRQRIERTL